MLAGLSGSRIAFYATSATVLPILMLAIVLQLRQGLLPRRIAKRIARFPLRVVRSVAALAVLLIWIADEFSIFSLADNRDHSFFMVELGLGIGLVLFFGGMLNEVTFQMLTGAAKPGLPAEEVADGDLSHPPPYDYDADDR